MVYIYHIEGEDRSHWVSYKLWARDNVPGVVDSWIMWDIDKNINILNQHLRKKFKAHMVFGEPDRFSPRTIKALAFRSEEDFLYFKLKFK
jgi:predicted hydrolase (HD superfamily)